MLQSNQVLYKVGDYELTQKIGNPNNREKPYEVFKASKLVSGVREYFTIYKFARTKMVEKKLDKCLDSYTKQISRFKQSKPQNLLEATEVVLTANSIYLIYPYCQDGSLEYRTVNQVLKFRDGELVVYLMQVLLGIWDLHKLGILHRKIKPSNIFFDSPDTNGLYRLKIGDISWFPPAEYELIAARGSDLHLAPEVLKSNAGLKYEPSANAWSIGYIAYYLLTGNSPNIPDFYDYQEANKIDTYLSTMKSVTGQYLNLRDRKYQSNPDYLGDFIKKTLVAETNRRLTFPQIYSHKLFEDLLSRTPRGWSKQSQTVIERFIQAKAYYSQNSYFQIEDSAILPELQSPWNFVESEPAYPNGPSPFFEGTYDQNNGQYDNEDNHNYEDNYSQTIMQPAPDNIKHDRARDEQLKLKRSLLQTYATVAQEFALDKRGPRLLQEIGIVLGMKGSFECEAYVYQLDQLVSDEANDPFTDGPIDRQNIDHEKISIQQINMSFKQVIRQADQLQEDDNDTFGKQCRILAASPFRLENQIDELLHQLIREYNSEVKSMRTEELRKKHRRNLGLAFLLLDPSTELDFKSNPESEDAFGQHEYSNFSIKQDGSIEPSDSLIDKLILKLGKIYLFNKY